MSDPTIHAERPFAHPAAVIRCRELHHAANTACDRCLTYYGIGEGSA